MSFPAICKAKHDLGKRGPLPQTAIRLSATPCRGRRCGLLAGARRRLRRRRSCQESEAKTDCLRVSQLILSPKIREEGHSMRVTILVLASAAALFAQVDRGNMQGTVTDPSNAAVAGAVVRIVSSATNLTQSTVTGPGGTYAFFNLPIGIYNLSVEGKGFRRSDVTGVQVEVNQQAKVDVTLQVGELTQTV